MEHKLVELKFTQPTSQVHFPLPEVPSEHWPWLQLGQLFSQEEPYLPGAQIVHDPDESLDQLVSQRQLPSPFIPELQLPFPQFGQAIYFKYVIFVNI